MRHATSFGPPPSLWSHSAASESERARPASLVPRLRLGTPPVESALLAPPAGNSPNERTESPAERQGRPARQPHEPFDYGSLSEPDRRHVREGALAIRQLLGSRQVIRSAEDVVQVGLRLRAVRELVGRWSFQGWLAAEFQWRQPAASKFMRSAAVFQNVDCLANFQASALYVLSRRGVGTAARAAAIEAAQAGTFVTKSLAESIVLEYAGSSAGIRAAETACRKLQKSIKKLGPAVTRRNGQAINRLARCCDVMSATLRRLLPGPVAVPVAESIGEILPIQFQEIVTKNSP